MVHVIPLSIAQRRRDPDKAAQAPEITPIAGPTRGYAGDVGELAAHYQQRMAQQEAFDTDFIRRHFDGQLAKAEDEAAAKAPADGRGLHDAIYGELDPYTGQVAKPGLFDALFQDILRQVPESQRADFIRQGSATREARSLRLAARQIQLRDDYEQARLDTVLNDNAAAIGKGDPDDTAGFEALRQDGLDLIAKRNLDPGIRQQVVRDWFATSAKARMEAQIARDPRRALEVLGAGEPVADDQQAGSLGTEPLADLSSDDVRRLLRQARTATAARLIEAHANIDLASQNAPDAIANTGNYSGTMPSPADFTAVYGVEEGGRRHQDFSRKIDVGRQVFGMRTMPNQAIHAALRDAEPGPGSSQDERERYDLLKKAISRSLVERADDPGGYVSRTFSDVLAAWDDASRNADYRNAINRSVAAQRQLGIDDIQPLPNSAADDIARTMMAEYAASGKIGNVRKISQGLSEYEEYLIFQIIVRSAILGMP